ncbi:lamin Dm0-like [Uranotaenia lowii]|uniref:lamin Dm0-like n=1 Tax=Uranotaenia lowii TaxID=190385 RepID=UPI0024797382|nr:lamin Dm0-like [Uranotaenia lowii]
MSSRSKKTPVPTSTSGAQSVSSSASTISSMTGSSETALSPSRRSRLHEKHSLINLNDRLACYIERVRYLEQENAKLSLEMSAYQENAEREVANLKNIYEGELTDARKLLDETARDKAKAEIDAKRYMEETELLRVKLNKKIKELAELEREARISEARIIELSSSYNNASSERKKLQDELKDLEKDNVKMKKTFETMRKDLEHETLIRVDLENNIQSLREELTFKEQVHNQELSESKMRRQNEISEIDGLLMEQYETKLQQTLQDLRDQYDQQIRMNRDEISDLYDARIQNLESRLNEERAQHEDERQKLEKELGRMRDEMSVQLKEYQDLMDIKTSLDMEIGAYDKLLSSEETRLNITPNVSSTTALGASLSTSRPPFRTPSLKRRRNALDDSVDFSISSTAKGDLEIAECDSEGKFIRIHNKSKQPYKLEGYKLVRRSDGNDITFKFSKSSKIEGEGTVTIYGSASQQKADPPTSLVMKAPSWGGLGENVTVLINADGEEIAHCQRIRARSTSRSVGPQDKYFLEEGGARVGVSGQGSTAEGTDKNNEQCSIM